MTAPAPEFTDDHIVDTIAVAIKRRDLEVVPGLITLLALQNPRLARQTLDAIEVGLVLAKEGQAS